MSPPCYEKKKKKKFRIVENVRRSTATCIIRQKPFWYCGIFFLYIFPVYVNADADKYYFIEKLLLYNINNCCYDYYFFPHLPIEWAKNYSVNKTLLLFDRRKTSYYKNIIMSSQRNNFTAYIPSTRVVYVLYVLCT